MTLCGGDKILIVSTADWNAPLWTNKQLMAAEIAKKYKVIFLEPLPHRNPEFKKDDFARVLRRIRNKIRNESTKNPNIQVISPIAIPIFCKKYKSLIFRINQKLLGRQLSKISCEITLIWSFTPLLTGLEKLKVPVVYHAVDLIHEIPNNHRELLLAAERRLSTYTSTYIIASSSGVREHLYEIGFEKVALWTNVARKYGSVINVNERRENSVIFVGNLVDFKIDFDLLNFLTLNLSSTRFHFVGPGRTVNKIYAHKNVKFHGYMSPQQCQALMRACSVGIIPYLKNEYTKGVLPLKLFEYLQAGLKVVTTELPSIKSLNLNLPFLLQAYSSDDFKTKIEFLLNSPFDTHKITNSGEKFSWDDRGMQARDLIASLLASEK